MAETASTATDIAVVAAVVVVVAGVAVANDVQVAAVVEYVDVTVVAEPIAFAGVAAASSGDGAWKSFQPELEHHSNLMSDEPSTRDGQEATVRKERPEFEALRAVAVAVAQADVDIAAVAVVVEKALMATEVAVEAADAVGGEAVLVV